MRFHYLALAALLPCEASTPLPTEYGEPTFAVRGSQPELFAAALSVVAAHGWELQWAHSRRGRLEVVDRSFEPATLWTLEIDRDRIRVHMRYLKHGVWQPPIVAAFHSYPRAHALIENIAAELDAQPTWLRSS